MALQPTSSYLYQELLNRVPSFVDKSSQSRQMLFFDNNVSTNIASGTSNIGIDCNLAPYMIYLPEAFVEITLTGWNTKVNYLQNFGFFKNGYIQIGDSQIEQINDIQLASTVRALIENSREYNESALAMASLDVLHAEKATTVGLRSVNQLALISATTGEKLILNVPLSAFFACVKWLPLLYGVDISLNFETNPVTGLAVESDAAATCFISNLRLCIPSYQPSGEVKTQIDTLLSTDAFESIVTVETAYTRNTPVSSASTGDTFSVSGTPTRVYLATPWSATAHPDRMHLNLPTDVNITSLQLQYDGTNVLTQNLRSLSAKDKGQAYRQYLDVLRHQNNVMGSAMSYGEFQDNIVYCFDLSAQNESVYSSKANHNLSYEITSTYNAQTYQLASVVILQKRIAIRGGNGKISVANV